MWLQGTRARFHSGVWAVAEHLTKCIFTLLENWRTYDGWPAQFKQVLRLPVVVFVRTCANTPAQLFAQPFPITTVGHSLGGGVAQLVAAMIHSKSNVREHLVRFSSCGLVLLRSGGHGGDFKSLFGAISVRCFAFCPAVVASASFHHALSLIPHKQLCITTIVVSHDIVPRLSHDSLVQFVQQLAGQGQSRSLPDDPMQVTGSRVLYCRDVDHELVLHEVPSRDTSHMNLLRGIHLRCNSLSAHFMCNLDSLA